jgi:HSP20 family protein
MLTRTDPFRQLERMTQHLFGAEGGLSRLAAVPMDAYRDGDQFVLNFDLPGVAAESIELDVERNVLTVRAERTAETGDQVRWHIAERPHGVFSRQVFLGESLDTDRVEAGYDAGVLTVRIPVADEAQPRKITVSGGRRQEIDA